MNWRSFAQAIFDKCPEDHLELCIDFVNLFGVLDFYASMIARRILSTIFSSSREGSSILILFFSLIKSFSFIFCILSTAKRNYLNTSSDLSTMSTVSFYLSASRLISDIILFIFYFIIMLYSYFCFLIYSSLSYGIKYFVVLKS